MLDFIPDKRKRAIFLRYPFIQDFFSGKHNEFDDFIDNINAFKQDLEQEGITDQDVRDLVLHAQFHQISQKTGKLVQELLTFPQKWEHYIQIRHEQLSHLLHNPQIPFQELIRQRIPYLYTATHGLQALIKELTHPIQFLADIKKSHQLNKKLASSFHFDQMARHLGLLIEDLNDVRHNLGEQEEHIKELYGKIVEKGKRLSGQRLFQAVYALTADYFQRRRRFMDSQTNITSALDRVNLRLQEIATIAHKAGLLPEDFYQRESAASKNRRSSKILLTAVTMKMLFLSIAGMHVQASDGANDLQTANSLSEIDLVERNVEHESNLDPDVLRLVENSGNHLTYQQVEYLLQNGFQNNEINYVCNAFDIYGESLTFEMILELKQIKKDFWDVFFNHREFKRSQMHYRMGKVTPAQIVELMKINPNIKLSSFVFNSFHYFGDISTDQVIELFKIRSDLQVEMLRNIQLQFPTVSFERIKEIVKLTRDQPGDILREINFLRGYVGRQLTFRDIEIIYQACPGFGFSQKENNAFDVNDIDKLPLDELTPEVKEFLLLVKLNRNFDSSTVREIGKLFGQELTMRQMRELAELTNHSPMEITRQVRTAGRFFDGKITFEQYLQIYRYNPRFDFTRLFEIYLEKNPIATEQLTPELALEILSYQRYWSFEYIGKFIEQYNQDLEQYKRFVKGQLTTEEILEFLNNNFDPDANDLLYIVLFYQDRKLEIIPHLIEMMENTSRYSPYYILLTWLTTKDGHTTPSIVQKLGWRLNYDDNLEVDIEDVLKNDAFINETRKHDMQVSSVISMAIALKRNLSNDYTQEEFHDKLNRLIRVRKKFEKRVLFGKGYSFVAVTHGEDTTYRPFLGGGYNSFDTHAIRNIASKHGASVEPELFEKPETMLQRIEDPALTHAYYQINGHGSPKLVSFSKSTLQEITYEQLFESLKKKALAIGDMSNITIDFTSCLSFDFVENLLNKWKHDPELKERKLLPPVMITAANKNRNASVYVNTVEFYLDSITPQKRNAPFRGTDFLRDIEPFKFCILGSTVNNDPGVFMPDYDNPGDFFKDETPSAEIGAAPEEPAYKKSYNA